MSTWGRPQESRLAERLRAVAEGLREAAPLLVEAQLKSFEGIASVVELAAQARAQEARHG